MTTADGKVPVTLLIDTEKSYLSVAHLVRDKTTNPNGSVIRYRAPRFKDVQEALYSLKKGVIPGFDDKADQLVAVALDTTTTLATATRWDLIAEQDANTDLWANRNKLFAQQRDWGNMSDMIGRLLAQFASWSDTTGIPTIVTSHENKRVDDVTGEKKGGPDLNRMLLSILMENTDYCWREWREDGPVKLDGKEWPKNTHYLRMSNSDKLMTKTRIPRQFSAGIPDALPDPNLVKAFALLGQFRPLFLTIFGPYGAGKTTLATSLSEPLSYK